LVDSREAAVSAADNPELGPGLKQQFERLGKNGMIVDKENVVFLHGTLMVHCPVNNNQKTIINVDTGTDTCYTIKS
jgi:hypothetical protein